MFVRRSSGFTLVEMAIVLVIIGLIVSAVLVGQTLVLASRIHSTSAQYNRIVTSAKTFQAKYRWLPGDMPPSYAQTYGLTAGPCYASGTSGSMVCSFAATNCLPDGCDWDHWYLIGNQHLDRGTREGGNFYTHLSKANLIDGDFGISKWTTTSGDQYMVFMEPRLKRGVIYPDYCTNRNCFIMGATISVPGAGQPGQLDMFTPFEAYGIDIKLDDGRPFTGIVSAVASYDDIARDYDGGIGVTITYPASQACCRFSVAGGGRDVTCSNASDYDIGYEDFGCMIQLKW